MTLKRVFFTDPPEFPNEISLYFLTVVTGVIPHPLLTSLPSLSHFPVTSISWDHLPKPWLGVCFWGNQRVTQHLFITNHYSKSFAAIDYFNSSTTQLPVFHFIFILHKREWRQGKVNSITWGHKVNMCWWQDSKHGFLCWRDWNLLIHVDTLPIL